MYLYKKWSTTNSATKYTLVYNSIHIEFFDNFLICSNLFTYSKIRQGTTHTSLIRR